jgi:prefoldin subunit 5
MKKIILLTLGVSLLLLPVGCVNKSLNRRVNALYDTVNQMNQDMVEIKKDIRDINQQIKELEGPDIASLQTLGERIDEINGQYIRLANEIVKVQQKVGMTTMEVAPPSYK